MKKFLAVLLIFALAASLSACGNESVSTSSVTSSVEATSSNDIALERKTVTPEKTDVLRGGRSYDFSELCWAGSSYEFQCTGDIVGAVITAKGGTIEVSIDKGEYKAITLKNGSFEYIFAENLSADTHTVRILRTDDTWTPAIKIDGVILSGSGNIVKNYVGDYKLKIEFVGDSLTSGLGVLHSKCYTTLVSDTLGAHFNVVSRTSKGLYIDAQYEDKGGLIRLYRSTVEGGAEDKPYTYNADLVVLNIGANDAGNLLFEIKDAQEKKDYLKEFERSYIEILDELLLANPNAAILCTYGQVPAVDHPEMEALIENVVAQYQKDHPEVKIDTFTFQHMFDESEGHPGVKSHQRDALALSMFIKNFLEL